MLKAKLKRLYKALGPGFITGAADDDPSGIATYSHTGAQFGYSQLWTALFSFPFMTIVQEMCGRIGMVTGSGISGVIRKHYSKPILYTAVILLLSANTINIGANLGAMASSAQLLFNLPFTVWLIVIATFSLTLQIFVSYPKYAKFLKYLTLSLFAYIATAFVIKHDWQAIALSTLMPTIRLDENYLMNIVAILGTTISPYLFFWQADQEVEEEIEHHKIRSMGRGVPHVTKKDIFEMRLDTTVGMFFSNIVMWFIIVTTASTLYVNGIFSVETADQAAMILRPLAGELAYLLFALGIIGTGLLAIPILAGSGAYALGEALKWRVGLNKSFSQAHGFYIVIALATIVGVLVNFSHIPPFTMLYYTAIINGIVAPPLMVIIMLIGSNKNIMGKHYNSRFSNVAGWMITGLMSLASIGLIASLVS